MTKVRTEVKVYKVTLLCDDCGEEMLPTGTALPTHPPRYHHMCSNGHIEDVRDEVYPYIEYKELIEKED